MPNKPAARKALRQSKKHHAWNVARATVLKSAVKKALKATDPDEVKRLLRAAQQAIDKARKRGVIKKNTAARKLSRLTRKVNAAAKK